MLKDFKGFILRGNVVDLAIGVVIGAAFGGVVDSLVTDIFTPLLAIGGTTNFENLSLKIGGGVVAYGLFLNALISFVTVAAAVFFFVVRPLGRVMASRGGTLDGAAPMKECPHCLSDIPNRAAVCSFCTRDVAVG